MKYLYVIIAATWLASAPVTLHAATTDTVEQKIEDTAARVQQLKDERAVLEAQEEAFLDSLDTPVALPPDEHFLGEIISADAATHEVDGATITTRTYEVRIIRGEGVGTTVIAEDSGFGAASQVVMTAGDKVVLVKSHQVGGEATFYVVDRYRLPTLAWLCVLFVLVAILVGRKRGVSSTFGLATTVVVIMAYVVPQIAAGRDPLFVCVTAAFGIAALSLFLAHGFSMRTTIAFVGTVLSLVIAVVLAVAYAAWAQLAGTGSDDVVLLQANGFAGLDLRGLLLGGIVLGALGILDDVTTAQTAVIEELKAANPSFGMRELFQRGISVGREHVASLVNTLFLAYAGVSLPLFLLFSLNKEVPWWLMANSAAIAEEIVRTLVGSTALILAVPLTTALAAAWFAKRPPKHAVEPHGHAHG